MTTKRNFQTTKTLAATGIVLLLTTALWAQAPTRLQVLVTSDRTKADATAQKLNALGAGPAEMREAGNTLKVLTRSYASLAEANFAKPALKGAGFMDAFAVAEEPTKDPTQTSPFGQMPSITAQFAFEQAKFDFQVAAPPKRSQRITPELEALDNQQADEQKLLAKAMGYYKSEQADAAIAAFDAFEKRFPSSAGAAQAKLMKAYWLVEKNDTAAARTQFEQVAAQYAGHKEAGEATLRLGYLKMRERRDSEALALFYSVAAGKVTAAEDVRVEAVLRTAALYHRGRDLDASEQAYGVVAQGATDAQARAFAEMQLAGLRLEKAWNKKATFAEARVKCDEVLARYPQADKAIRATAALMALETLSYENSYGEVLKREKDFLDEFAHSDESTLAFFWFAKARLETGDAKGACAILDSLIDAKLPSEKRFKHVEVTSQARRLAAKAYDKLGDKAKAKALLEAR